MGLWRQGNRLIAAKHHEGLVLWLAEMKEDEEEEEDEEEDEEDEEEGREDEEEEKEALETHREKRQRTVAASSQQAPSNSITPFFIPP